MITAARRKSLSLAGLMFVKVNALRVVRHSGNPSKPVILWATDSGFVEVYFETSTRAGKRSETDYLEDSVSGAGGGCGAHHTASYKLPHRDKKGLRTDGIPVYGYSAPAKSGAGIGVLVIRMATHDAPSVFFCAVSLTHPFFERWDIIQRLARAMVAQAGASSEAPVSIRAGYANPAWATTSEIGVSGGSVTRYRMEAAAWLLPSPKFRNLSGLSPLFAAICRQLPQKFTISPHLLSVKPAVLWFGITSAFSLVASVWRWLMRNYFRITGYAVNKRGLTVGIGYQLISSDTKTATAHAVLQAQREGLSHVRITRVREVAA
ncbi:ash family protein [Klebsiella pneumoniae]|uniref:ash family protein n=1 Tax=Klebsiella pneumoniae TaxID=573 RepID=UPI0019106858|nr:ash family protein [Klebsiella pneumoniae]HDZ9166331.1 ash family protein [Klebsiella quasipneumoniae subsp. quasipneumoniae]EKU0006803.1 ash family protein [Klebsiella pneumoniae]EKU0092568.1 ash family protein [Klebsiella pneumoniae]EKU4577119.1 ash family protein [Klebsiella pneumoniae]